MRESSKKTTEKAAKKASKTKTTVKPAADKISSQKTPGRKITASPKGGEKKNRSKAPGKPAITSEERRKMIAEAAYYLAEKRGFQNSNPAENWFQAEAQIDALLVAAPKPKKNKPSAA